MFEWNPAFSVSIGTIDAQHRSLLAIGRELWNAISTGQSRALTYNIVDRLVRYAPIHFAHEERLMRARGYPDLPAHKAEHAELARKAAEFGADFKAGRAPMSMDTLQLIEDAFVSHFQEWDHKYSNFVHGKAA